MYCRQLKIYMTCSVNKKKCVYTALTGGYDNLIQPDYIAEDYDYICFSNDITSDRVGVWEIRPIPFEHKDNTRVSRYPKFHPHLLLQEYDYSIYLDANIRIKDNYIYEKADRLYSEGVAIGHVAHPFRSCIYQDLFSNMLYGKDSTVGLVKTLYFLLKNEYPFNAGLFENSVIFWSHHKPVVAEAMDMFWEIYIRHSRRDQLSLCYVYRTLDIHPALFLPDGENMRNSEHIESVSHNGVISVSARKDVVNRVKIKLVRIMFRMMGYDLSHQALHKS